MGGRILREDVDAVREAIDTVALVGERVALKKSGRQFVGLCPFHNEKTPSFSLSADKGVYYCHGCGAHGNIFQFLMRLDGLDFAEAVEACARRTGIALRYDGSGGRSSDTGGQRRRLIEAHAEAVAFYHHMLMKDEAGGPARGYWRQRGFGPEDAERFQIGFAPDAWDRLIRYLGEKGFASELLVEAGIAARSRTGRVIDRFRARVMFPILSQSGEPIGFGARTLPGGGDPKYLNSPETPLYSKGRVLFHLFGAKSEILARHEAIVVEGYTDVIALVRAGVPNAVATCGTALGEGHLDMLRRYGTGTDPLRVVLAFDADAAGRAAGERGFELYGRFALDMRAAALPEGQDPADFALSDPEGARDAVAGAIPLMEFKLRTVLAGRRQADPESRARALRAAASALALHPDDIARGIWTQWLSDELDIDRAVVDKEVRRARSGARSKTPPPLARETTSDAMLRKEAELVRVAIFGPSTLAESARLWPAEDLTDPRARAALRALEAGSVDAALEQLEGEAAAYLAQCAVDEPDVEDVGIWAREVLARFELDRVSREERALEVEDLEDLTKQIALIRRRHALMDS